MERHSPPLLPLAALIVFVASRCLVPMDETDLFFNLRLGEIVISSGRVPTTNLLSFTYPDHRDVNLAWIFQVLLALVHRAGGIPATVIMKTAFAVATFALLHRAATARGAHPVVAAAALALAAWAVEPRLVERPHLVTFLGIGLLLVALERVEAGRPRALWLFVPSALVWANANSCLFLAPVILALYATGALLDRRLEPPDGPARPAMREMARRAALVALAMAPFILATPTGVHSIGYIANHFGMPSLRPLQEYRTASWPVDGPFVLLAAALVVGTAVAPRGARLRVLLPAVALGLLGWRRIRFVAEFALLAGPAVAVAWTRAFERMRPAAWRPAWSRALGLAAVAGLGALAAWPRIADARAGRKWLDIGMEENLVPEGPIRVVTTLGLRARMYNDLEIGSYLAWEGWPRHRVFQDPRINGYPDRFHAILRRKDLPRAEFQALLDEHGVTSALVSYPSVNPRAALFDPVLWAPVHRSPHGLAFARRIPEHQDTIKSWELPLTFSYAEETGTMVHPVERQPPESQLRACEWSRRLGEFFLSQGNIRRAWESYRLALPEGDDSCIDLEARQATRIAMAGLAMRLQDPNVAVELYRDLPDPESKTNRAFALLRLRRFDEALRELDAALKLAPRSAETLFGRGVALMELHRRDEAVAALKEFLAQAPGHMAADDARQRLSHLGATPPAAPPGTPPRAAPGTERPRSR